METTISKESRKRSMEEVDAVIDVLVEQFPSLTLEKCHQILDTTKEVLTLLSINGYNGIKRRKQEHV